MSPEYMTDAEWEAFVQLVHADKLVERTVVELQVQP